LALAGFSASAAHKLLSSRPIAGPCESKTKGCAAAVFVFFVAVAAISAYGIAGSLAQTPTPPRPAAGGARARTQVLNESAPGPCAVLVNTVSSQAYSINTLVSSASARLGVVVCVNVVLQNIDGRNLTLSSDGGLTISYNITETDGAAVYHNSCTTAASGDSTASKGPIGSWSCGGRWDTGAAYDGTLPGPGTYRIVAKVDVPDIVGAARSAVGSTASISLSG
jgi:hypothetical protein